MNAERECCHAVAALLAAHGVNRAVISPGSRNAPLIEAIDSIGSIHITVVIDERSAAFVALGMASVTGNCVALVCTSGSALLNYAPALAEAAYRHIPLIVISADRAHEWINRNDGQTIIQTTAYGEFIRRRFSIDSRDTDAFRDITVNDAINAACSFPCGPVHINIEIPDPSLTGDRMPERCIENHPRCIRFIGRSMTIDKDCIVRLASRLTPSTRVMIVAGCYHPDQRLNKALIRLCSFGNFIVMADSISNLHGRGIINTIDTVLSGTARETADRLKPDIVISHGGAILSAQLKKYLREHAVEHWHIGGEEHLQDTYRSLALSIDTAPEYFYPQLIAAMHRTNEHSDYTEQWIRLADAATDSASRFIHDAGWCDMTAVCRILSMTPRRYNIQLSNGMSVRYAQLLPFGHHRYDCNRGVSGIEGSTSTAAGAAAGYKDGTLLITGDMSAAYDMSALSLECIPPGFRMVVISNGGGGIFNYIKGTSGYEKVDRYMVAQRDFDVSAVAASYGFRIYTAANMKELEISYRRMLDDNGCKSLLTVRTSSVESAQIMKQFIHRNVYFK